MASAIQLDVSRRQDTYTDTLGKHSKAAKRVIPAICLAHLQGCSKGNPSKRPCCVQTFFQRYYKPRHICAYPQSESTYRGSRRREGKVLSGIYSYVSQPPLVCCTIPARHGVQRRAAHISAWWGGHLHCSNMGESKRSRKRNGGNSSAGTADFTN